MKKGSRRKETSRQIKCIVLNREDPDQKTFFVSVNGESFIGQCGTEIILNENQIEVLRNAIRLTYMVDETKPLVEFREHTIIPSVRTITTIKNPRFEVIEKGEVTEGSSEEDLKVV